MKKPDLAAFNTTDKEVKPLKSSMEAMPEIKPAQKPTTKAYQVQQPPVPPVRDVLPVQGGRRKIKSRHPFDIYEDQVDTLKQLSLEDRMRGGQGSMSAMVREALDDYFTKVKGQDE